MALAITKKLITFPVIAPKCFLPKKRGQETAFTTAKASVKYAMTRDCKSGGRIRTFKV